MFEIISNVLSLSTSFAYLCYEYTAIINSLILSVRGPSLYASNVYRRQILTYKDGPRTVRVNDKKQRNSVILREFPVKK